MKNLNGTNQAPGPYTFDGHGINANDEYKSRITTITPARFFPVPAGPAHLVGESQEISRQATAQLLIAAPEMLDALENLFKECVMIHRYGGESSNVKAADKAVKAAQAAILKAKGRL